MDPLQAGAVLRRANLAAKFPDSVAVMASPMTRTPANRKRSSSRRTMGWRCCWSFKRRAPGSIERVPAQRVDAVPAVLSANRWRPAPARPES
jgi:hypothetical protein